MRHRDDGSANQPEHDSPTIDEASGQPAADEVDTPPIPAAGGGNDTPPADPPEGPPPAPDPGEEDPDGGEPPVDPLIAQMREVHAPLTETEVSRAQSGLAAAHTLPEEMSPASFADGDQGTVAPQPAPEQTGDVHEKSAMLTPYASNEDYPVTMSELDKARQYVQAMGIPLDAEGQEQLAQALAITGIPPIEPTDRAKEAVQGLLPQEPVAVSSDMPETGAGDSNDFTSIDVWYDNEPLRVTPEEQTVLAVSAAQFETFTPEVDRLSDVYTRYKAGDRSHPDDELPLGNDAGLDATAYATEINGKRYVVRFAKGEDNDENTEMTKLRLLTLARTDLHEAPHLERLVTYSLTRNAVVTEWAEGIPANELSPEDITNIPTGVLVDLQETATKMEAAKVALDIKWGAEGEASEDALDTVVAHYGAQAGPTYFDLTNIESDPRRSNEAGRHYAELVTTMVATGYSLDATADQSYRTLALRDVAARIKLFDEAYRLLQASWPNSSGAGWLARTAGRMIQTLPAHEQDLVMEGADGLALPLDYRDEY